MSNRSVGNKFEQEFCDLLSQNGYWSHNLKQNASGQPADVIAVKNNVAFLIDCKDCARNKFVLSRIEENQKLAMCMFRTYGNKQTWFALRLNTGEIFMFPYNLLSAYAHRHKEMSEASIREIGIPIEGWLE